jgi:folylpolyglutamate synthase/dihydropteroate synthase
MKPVILGVAGLLLGLGGGTGVTMMKNKKLQAQVAVVAAEAAGKGEKKPHAAATGDSSHVADSSHAASPADTTTAHAEPDAGIPSAALAPAKPVEAAHGAETKAPATASAATPAMGKGEVRPARAPAAKPDSAQRAAGFKQLARIFGSMKAADAVKVMALMTDDEVDGVLRSLGPKQAADLMGEFPKERAAALSRRLLVATVKS